MRRIGIILPAAVLGLLLTAGPALGCGGLIGPNGAVNLLRTTTFAGYHDGEEHYVTSFEFAGGGGAFGSITPLPGVPSTVVKGGDWTLQRLIRETDPVPEAAFFSADSVRSAASAVELMKVKIDALDVTVLKGGAAAIGQWAKDHGFRLPPDAPEVLEFYASRSPIFLAAAFDADAAAARGQQVGDGTPVHVTIPTDNNRGSRCGSWRSARPARSGSRPTSTSSRTAPRRSSDADRRERPDPRPQRRGQPVAPRRPAERPRHGVDPFIGLADEARRRLVGGRPVLRPRDRRVGRERAVPDRRRVRAAGHPAGRQGGRVGRRRHRARAAAARAAARRRRIFGIWLMTRYRPGGEVR